MASHARMATTLPWPLKSWRFSAWLLIWMTLKARLNKIVVAYTRDHKPVHASDILGTGAMTVLLKDAWRPI